MAQGLGCTPQRIFGTYEQTLFLGMTIQDFSATVGWDQQYTTLAVNLIQDDCSGYRWYYKVDPPDDYTDTPWTWVYEEFTEGDPGFNGADVGSPVLLKIGETRELDENGLPTDDIISKGFEFAGIIQSINIKNDSQGRNVYTINLISPGVLLDGGGVILSDFAESLPYNPNTNDFVPNIFNVYGFLESIYDVNTGKFRCPGFGGFGSPCGGYGNARLTDNGIPWFLAKQALQVLAGGRYNGGFGSCVFARPPGTLVFKPGVNSYGSLPDGQYILDIDDIPIPEDLDTLNNYRVTGPIKTINELLSEVTSDAGCNYYVDMLPTFDAGNPTKITNVIKIRVVKRSPTDPGEPLNDINNFIASKEADAGVKVITSSSSGTEYIPEYTSAFIIGGSEKRLYRATTDGLEDQNTTPIVPFVAMIGTERTQAVRSLWGQTFFPGSYFDAQWYFDINWRELNYIRPPVLPSIAVDDTIPESMLYAANYGVENWLRWVFQYGAAPDNAAIGRPAFAHGIYQYLITTLGVPTYGVINNLALAERDPLSPGEEINDSQKLVDTWHAQIKAFWDQLGNNIKADIDTLYQYIAAHAQTLGHFWTVQVPFACKRNVTDANDLFGTNPSDPFSNDTDIYEYSDLPSTEGGWLDTVSTSDLSIGQLGQANLMGLRHRLDTDAFSSENGLIGAILRWDSVFNDFDNGFVKASEAVYKNASEDLGTPGLWVRASIAPNWVNIPDQRRGSQDINLCALLQINSFVSTKFGDKSLAANFAVPRSFAGGFGGWNVRKLYDVNPGADVVSRVNFLNRRFDRSNYVRPALAPFALPRDAVIPVLSNTKNYGPWHYNATFSNSQTDVKGKTLTVQDEGFVPWEYGGSKWMSKGAEYLAESSISDVDRGERGAVTIAGYPENQLGAEITRQPINLSDRIIEVRDYGGFEYNYINVGGLSTATSQITNLSVSVGPGGITTQYQLSSFTPIFAAFNKLDQDRIRDIAKQNFKIQKSNRLFAKGSYNTIREAIREWMRVSGAGGDNPFLSDMLNAQAPSSMHVLMLGKYEEVPNKGYSYKSVNTSNARDVVTLGDTYDFSSLMSFDGFFRPIKTKKGTHPDLNALPQDNQPGTPPAAQPKQSVDPYGPLNAGVRPYVGPVINKDYLDFLANPTDALVTQRDSAYDESSPSGHDIEVVGRDTLANIQTLNDGYLGIRDPNNLSNYQDGYRYLAHRGPLVVHGWGYDIMGKPIPNQYENNQYAEGSSQFQYNGGKSGTHQTNYSGLSDQFYGGWLQNPDTWPAGPVDLRWDRNRGVWTVPSDLRFYHVRLDSNLSGVGSTAVCNVRNAQDVFDEGGNVISNPRVTVTMPYKDTSIAAGQDILVYWSHESGMYFPIQACCDGGGGTPDPPVDPPMPCDYCGGNECMWKCVGGLWVPEGPHNCNGATAITNCICSPPGNCENCPTTREGEKVVGACVQQRCYQPPGPCGGGGGAQGDSCLIADTLIKTPHGLRHIDSLIIGDKINTHQGVGNVVNIYESTVNQVYIILFEDDSSITSSESHPFALMGKTIDLSDESQYMQAKNLKIGDIILGEVSNKTIKDIKLDKKDTKVYNLTVSNGHSYVSNGVYSHNKIYAPYSFTADPLHSGNIVYASSNGGPSGIAGFTKIVRSTLNDDFTNYDQTGNAIFFATTLEGESVQWSGSMLNVIDPTGNWYQACIITPGTSNSGFDYCPPYGGSGSEAFTQAAIMNQAISDHIPSGSYLTLAFNNRYLLYEIVEWEATGTCVTVTGTDSYALYYPHISADASAANVVVRLPLSTGVGIPGKEFTIKKIDSSVNTVTISGSGGNLIDGQSSYTLNNQYEAARFVACGTDWMIF